MILQHAAAKLSFLGAILQIMLLDIVFSPDSVITAVGMVRNFPVMIAAIVISIALMMVAAKQISSRGSAYWHGFKAPGNAGGVPEKYR